MRKTVLVVMMILVAMSAIAADVQLQRVEPKKVCMINEQVFEKDQIPVEVEGKTYYGCCAMCKKALASDASKRVAIDPVSKKEVDKAKAIIGALADGSVLYFENEKNFDKYAAELARKK
jgi:YHS domain-containing protein